MESFILQIVSGLAVGGVYASLALALVMIYQTTDLVNLSQGELAMASTYLAWVLIGNGIPYWLSFVITLGVSFAAGYYLERVLMRHFKKAPLHSVLIVMIGLMVLINGSIGVIFGYELKYFESPFDGLGGLTRGYLSSHEAGIALVTLTVMTLVFCFFRFTRIGLAMRAAAVNPLSASFVGVNVSVMLSLGWALAAMIGAVSGVLTAPIVYLDPNMMLNILIYSFAGALLGGITSPLGAVVGGLMIGVAENLAGAYLVGTDMKLAFILAVIIGILLLKPNGLFGRNVVVRV
jgi:branched-chain amino acid transport system permease protein